MNRSKNAIYEIHQLEKLAAEEQWINRIHPLLKLLVTVFYIAIVVSFSKYDFFGLLAMGIYPAMLFPIANRSFLKCIKRLRVILPLLAIVGIANPFLDRALVDLGLFTIRAGMISMVTLLLKGFFSVLAGYLLVTTTSIEGICYAFRKLHVPEIIVTQILLTYRYITLLLAEVNRITQAYSLRAPKQKGVHYKVWGSLTGQLLLRSIDRSNEVFQSMTIRGFQGQFYATGRKQSLSMGEVLYFVFWISFFVFLRKVPLILLLGQLFG